MLVTLLKLSVSKKLKLIFFFLYFCGISLSINATTYTFTGSGDWDIAANWAGNNIAPHSSGANDIIINGTVTSSGVVIAINTGGTLTINGTFTEYTQLNNDGAITINNGGNLILDRLVVYNPCKFYNYSALNINSGGAFKNLGAEVDAFGQITVNGLFLNSTTTGVFYTGSASEFIKIGGTLTNTSTFWGPVSMTILSTGVFNNSGGLVINSPYNNLTINTGGILNNTGTISGNGTIGNNFSNPGTIAPGNSPGLITVSGDYTATSTAIHNMEIAGTSAAQYDRINASGNVVLGGTLNASLISGFVPSGNHDLAIISGAAVTGTFSTVNIPSGYLLIYNPTNVTLRFGGTLPVDLTSLTAKPVNKTVQLSWQTSFEQNNKGFSVERSADGINWQEISFVNSLGNSSITRNYSYTDTKPFSGNVYYRLKQVDLDAHSKYSYIVAVNSKNNTQLLILFPNPAKDQLNFTQPVSGELSIFNLSGQNVLKQQVNNSTGISIANLSSGQYIIKLKNKNGDTEEGKFIVQ